jgi:NTP pyrophosphatase (non-canonical NTP hydrolase)
MDARYVPDDLDGCLSRLIEECGEVLAAAGKIQRFGWLGGHPDLDPETREKNVEWLLRELEDLSDAQRRLKNAVYAKLGV